MSSNRGAARFLTVLSLLNETTPSLSRYCPDTPRLDAEVILAHVLETDKTGLYLWPQRRVSQREYEQFQALICRRTQGEPVAYIVGRKEFWSLPFRVTEAVMIPRPQTETLAEAALEIFPPDASPRILEIGTGSGAISVALARELPRASLIATDISFEALSVARQNAAANGVTSIQFLHGDLFAPLEEGHDFFDLILSNPPYIPSGDITALPRGIRDYEPHIALDGGKDGLDHYRAIAETAHRYLKPGGGLLVEVGDTQSHAVCDILSHLPAFSAPATVKDLLSIERVVKAFRI
ncbi:MAG: peptide chain release factor N(5)-glutamine methyltransferase [Deltaproteobacteria bacterium]|nr:peptide chain release factor N(5)-glutamine methyltransferase [Deltaproteobacteria bacterium]